MAATTKTGRIASVRVGTYKVAGQGTWSYSGFSREIIEEDSWDLDIKKKHFGVGDAGELTFSGLYASADTTGQDLLDSACLNSSAFTHDSLRFYIDSVSYWTVDTGFDMKTSKCQAITFEKSAMGIVDFTAVPSGGHMVLM